MKPIHLPLALAGLGVLLIGLAFAWPSVIPTEMVWTAEEARELSQAATELHQLSDQRTHRPNRDAERGHGLDHGHDHVTAPPEMDGGPQPQDAAWEAAKQRYERSRAKLHAAQSTRPKLAAYLKWIGIVSSLAGVVGYGLLRAHSS